MRISDWSSDVCSSDLRRRTGADRRARVRGLLPHRRGHRPLRQREEDPLPGSRLVRQLRGLLRARDHRGQSRREPPAAGALRSEEHTSELQSLMRISYAVFCLKKKKQITLSTYTRNLLDSLTS